MHKTLGRFSMNSSCPRIIFLNFGIHYANWTLFGESLYFALIGEEMVAFLSFQMACRVQLGHLEFQDLVLYIHSRRLI